MTDTGGVEPLVGGDAVAGPATLFGLCPPLPAHDEDELRCWLLDHGASEEQLKDADDLMRVAADLAVTRGVEFSAWDIAERLGSDPDRVLLLFRTLGVVVADEHEVVFTEADVHTVEGFEASGSLNSADGQALMRVISNALDRVAEAGVALFVQGTEAKLARDGAPPLSWAKETARMTMLATDLGMGMGVVFRHHLRQAIERQRVTQAEVTSRDVARFAVGFVDLAGSTALAQTLEVADLRKLVSEFEAQAFDVAAQFGGRVIKFIGDEIMVASLDPEAGCRLILALVEACATGGMQPRGGLAWGEVLFRSGDYYGREVNLASRLVDAAIPGEVLVDTSVVRAVCGGELQTGCQGGFSFERAGRRLLKGFSDPVEVWSVLRTDDLP